MAELPDQTITMILELQRRLVQLINQAGATELSVFEIFGLEKQEVEQRGQRFGS